MALGKMSGDVTEPTVAQLKRVSGERWRALPPVIRSTFECARKVSMTQSLKAMGVETSASKLFDLARESWNGTLVVRVWHDQIDVEPDGSLSYRIDGLQLQAGFAGTAAARLERMRKLFTAHVDREVRVLLLKRGWDGYDTQKVERNAPDLRNWELESAGGDRFVLRRAVLKKAA